MATQAPACVVMPPRRLSAFQCPLSLCPHHRQCSPPPNAAPYPTQAMFLRLTSGPDADPSSWRMYKLGRPISPLDVVVNGSKSMHAVTDEGVHVDSAGANCGQRLVVRCVHMPQKQVAGLYPCISFRSLDAALVSPGAPTAFPNTHTDPDLREGVSFNLWNNLWCVMQVSMDEHQQHVQHTGVQTT